MSTVTNMPRFDDMELKRPKGRGHRRHVSKFDRKQSHSRRRRNWKVLGHMIAIRVTNERALGFAA